MRTTDNNNGKSLADISEPNSSETDISKVMSAITQIANKTLFELQKSNPELLVFPKEIGLNHDDIGKSRICSLDDDKLTTYNIMGFIGINDMRLTVSSRFTEDCPRDYFLHYMLGKVLSFNVVNLDIAKDHDGIEDFLPYLFPTYLKSALSQGIFKEYRRNEYNNANVRGMIDIPRNIRLNTPFMGKIAYNTREYCYDNTMTQLIRHTIEHLKTLPIARTIITADANIRSDVQKIIDSTLSYNKNDKRKIINANLKAVRHPYYTDYLQLQRLCLQILGHERVSFGTDKNKIHGLLFNGAWLWEEYLNSILKNDFSHPDNRTRKGKAYYLFKGHRQRIYPDFISNDETIIADAKYKHLETSDNNDEYGREDYYQIITYMHRFHAKNGFLLFPHIETIFDKRYSIEGTGDSGQLTKLGLAIPKQTNTYKLFCELIDKEEKEYISKILEISTR